MIEERKNSILGPTGRMLVDTKPVGGRIPRSHYGEWEKFKSRCTIASLQVSPMGMLDMLQTYNKINDIIFPMASAYNFQPIQFKNDVLDIMLHALKELNQQKWIKDSETFKSQIKEKIDEVVKVSIE